MSDYSALIGMKLKPTKFKVKKKKLLEFAVSIGAKQSLYNDENNPIAHPAYANAYVLPALMSINEAKTADGSALIKNPLKILHGGQIYYFPKGAPPIKDGDKLVTTPAIKDIELKSNGMLLITCTAETIKDESKEVVCNSEIGVVVMPGGF
ncbi:MAG TPA: MaoC family dehydratase N-terminal domain-containing protein [Candidatus Deferrimicrobium sp.]|nr:MaoC family dehydratase N-terminal domain-containing protein [Candidatus Deferrimicrobium sp.]